MREQLGRRAFLAQSGAALAMGVAAGMTASSSDAAPRSAKSEPFRYCLNTSTIRGQELSLVEKVEIAAKAGYSGIEPWINEIDQHVAGGGTLKDLRKRIADLGLTVESAIGFPEWIVDDDGRRAKGMEEARRCMGLMQELGGARLAAPAAGATDQTDLNLLKAAERYRALLELGEQFGVVPLVEVWGFSKTLQRLGEATLVAIESNHPKASILPDIYHLYRGGSDFHGLKLLTGSAIPLFHVNDYPAAPPRAQLTDGHRVYPGDGVAPLASVFRDLNAIGFRGALSLELFNKEYWKQDPLLVARTGLEKTRAAVRKSFEG
jgi:sugar phosphate isomerase/epimerase